MSLVALVAAPIGQVCLPTDMDMYCPNMPISNCTHKDAQFDFRFDRLGSTQYPAGSRSADFCCHQELGQCPFPDLDAMFDTCQDFCAEGTGQVAIPVLVGGETFGLNLDSATDVCLNSAAVVGANKASYDTCMKGKGSLTYVNDAVVDFISEMRKFAYSVLTYQNEIKSQIEVIKQRLREPSVVRAIARASRSQKAEIIKGIYNDVVAVSPGNTVLTQAIGSVRTSSANMQVVLNKQLNEFNAFVRDCNRFFPKVNAFLLDMCTDTGNGCLESEEAEHVTCCCFNNPVSNMQRFSFLAPPPAPPSPPPFVGSPPPSVTPAVTPETTGDVYSARRLAATVASHMEDTTTRLLEAAIGKMTDEMEEEVTRQLSETQLTYGIEDVCATSYERSEPQISNLRKDLQLAGGQSTYENYENELKARYGQFYCVYDKKVLTKHEKGWMIIGIVSFVVWSLILLVSFFFCCISFSCGKDCFARVPLGPEILQFSVDTTQRLASFTQKAASEAEPRAGSVRRRADEQTKLKAAGKK